MSERRIQHPLGAFRFYAECARYATSGLLGVVGDAGTILGMFALVLRSVAPTSYTRAAAFLQAKGYHEDLLIWIPLAIGASILMLRLLLAPLIVYRDGASIPDRTGLRLYFIGDRAHVLPTHSKGVVGVFDLQEGSPDRNTIGSTGLVFDTDHPRDLSWEGHPRRECARCELTNHSDLPLVNVALEFKVTFREAIQQPADNELGFTYVAGKAVWSAPWRIQITRLLPGPDNRAVFYLCNTRNVFMTLLLPDFATVQTFEDPRDLKVRLPRVQYPEVYLFNVAQQRTSAYIPPLA